GRNNNHRKKINTDTCTSLVSYSDRILNDGTPRVDIAKKVVSPSVVEETVVKEKLSHVENTTVLGSKQQLPMQDSTSASNAFGKSLYANVTGKPSGTKLNFRTLFTPGKRHLDVKLLKEDVGNVLVWVKLHGVLVTAFSGDCLSVIATKLGTTSMLHSYTSDMCMQSWGICACCMVFGHTQKECPKNISTGEMKNLKKTSQTPNGFPVDQKMEFKSTKQVYQPVSKKPTANTSVNKKKKVDYAKEVREVTLMDDVGKPFEKVASSCDYDSEDESLLEQWTESYENGDYGYDKYDNDMYEGQDIHEKLQAICDILDIAVRGRRKK
nr:hypothetical protein [Tanacetum cinerariifolium]